MTIDEEVRLVFEQACMLASHDPNPDPVIFIDRLCMTLDVLKRRVHKSRSTIQDLEPTRSGGSRVTYG